MKVDRHPESVKLNQRRRMLEGQKENELHVMLGFQTHKHLLLIVRTLPTDFTPWGERDRAKCQCSADCPCGCRWFHTLAGRAGHDWGICANLDSPRVGLLTFEHQGCPAFEKDARHEYLESRAGQKARWEYEMKEHRLLLDQKNVYFSPHAHAEPEVGIFWLVGRRLVLDTTPLHEAEAYGVCLNHVKSHIDRWSEMQQEGIVPRDMEYEECPRGRVVYGTKAQEFTLLADRCILKSKSALARLLKRMHLPEGTIIDVDLHYRCFKCLRGSSPAE
jgi:hypothetical protein